MADRSLLAKLGVFVLLGANVGAYYLFWPKNNGLPTERAELAPQVAPAERIPVAPKNFPAASVKDAEPLQIPVKDEKGTDLKDAVSRLLDHIQKENAQPIPVVGELQGLPTPIPAPPPLERAPSDPAPALPSENPRALPSLQGEPIKDPGERVTEPLVPTLPGTQKNPTNAWVVNMKKSGTQTLVTVKLRLTLAAKLPVEFSILCDRVDPIGADGLRAFGNITFVGGGIKGGCQRLLVPWNSPNVIFEEQVRILPEDGRGGGQLRGERFVWEQPSNDVDVYAPEFRPAGVSLPGAPLPGGLGSPK